MKSSNAHNTNDSQSNTTPQTLSEVIYDTLSYPAQRRAAWQRIRDKGQHFSAAFAGFIFIELALFSSVFAIIFLRLSPSSPLPSPQSFLSFVTNHTTPQPSDIITISADQSTLLCKVFFITSLLLLILGIPILIKGMKHLRQIISDTPESDTEIIEYHAKKKLLGHIGLLLLLLGTLLFTIFR